MEPFVISKIAVLVSNLIILCGTFAVFFILCYKTRKLIPFISTWPLWPILCFTIFEILLDYLLKANREISISVNYLMVISNMLLSGFVLIWIYKRTIYLIENYDFKREDEFIQQLKRKHSSNK